MLLKFNLKTRSLQRRENDNNYKHVHTWNSVLLTKFYNLIFKVSVPPASLLDSYKVHTFFYK